MKRAPHKPVLNGSTNSLQLERKEMLDSERRRCVAEIAALNQRIAGIDASLAKLKPMIARSAQHK